MRAVAGRGRAAPRAGSGGRKRGPRVRVGGDDRRAECVSEQVQGVGVCIRVVCVPGRAPLMPGWVAAVLIRRILLCGHVPPAIRPHPTSAQASTYSAPGSSAPTGQTRSREVSAGLCISVDRLASDLCGSADWADAMGFRAIRSADIGMSRQVATGSGHGGSLHILIVSRSCHGLDHTCRGNGHAWKHGR